MTHRIKITRAISEDKGTPELRAVIAGGVICEIVGHFWIEATNMDHQTRICQLCGKNQSLKITREWIDND